MSAKAEAAVSADEALQQLEEGNQRFIAGTTSFAPNFPCSLRVSLSLRGFASQRPNCAAANAKSAVLAALLRTIPRAWKTGSSVG